MSLLQLTVLAFLCEAIWETTKMIWENGKFSADRVGSLAFGLIVSLLSGADLFDLLGIPLYLPYVGMALTGILISRGANFIHDIINYVNSLK